MKTHRLTFLLIFGVTWFCSLATAFGQKSIHVSGTVVDAKTNEPLPFVNVVFLDKNIGTITDYNGQYSFETRWASDNLQASFMGYVLQVKPVSSDKNQVINFKLISETYDLTEVEVKDQRVRYRNKDNPAVELIRKVIENKSQNRKEKLDYYSYDKYEKVEFDLNNITREFRNKKAFKKLQFVFDYVDTSQINGKPYLPVFLKETVSKVYYRKSPSAQKEYVSGTNMVGFHDYIDNDGIGFLIDNLYQDIDIYDNSITLLTNEFVSPISTLSPMVYKFHILDTVDVNSYNCINLAFQPRNKADFAFKGNLFITNDDRYAVIKANMRVMEDINLNFVNDLEIIQEFSYLNNEVWMLTKDELVVDFNFNLVKNGTGVYGKKKVYFDHYTFNQEISDTTFSKVENTIRAEDYKNQSDEFWKQKRLTELSKQEAGIFTMIDSVQNVPAFKRTIDVVMLLLAGYWNFGDFDLGPVNTFYSFNDVEGFRLRLGGRTSEKFSKRFQLNGYLLYGFKDEQLKYSASATWSINKKPLKDNPRHSIQVMYQKETNFPGMEMQFINEDNFLLSFKRGTADKILYYNQYKIEHYRDWGNGFSTTLNFKHMVQEPGGTLHFDYANHSLANIVSSEIATIIRFAPNEKFYQGMDYKTPIITKNPIFQLNYTQGINGLIGADFTYSKLSLNIFKRFYLGLIGYTDIEAEGGKVFGSGIPFPLLYIHRANQTYSYQLLSYNLMNFLEFVSDAYLAVYAEHHFNGLFFNKIPLLKRLKLREIISFKGVYGGVTDPNNPAKTSGLMKLPTDLNGDPTTFTFNDQPYMEASVGIGNIFKVFRVDLIKRLTYLDNPDVSEYGIRVRFKFDF
ncbi:MAG: DUF5686 family protein [Bacteroidales bacterium]|jgi:hypothetical protein